MRPTEMLHLAESLFIAAAITAVPCFAVLRWIVLLAARPLGPLTIEHVSDPLRAKQLRARQWECSNVRSEQQHVIKILPFAVGHAIMILALS